MKQDTVVEVRDLSVDFETIDGTLRVLDGVHFHIRRGEMIGIVGETGCGKSVTAKMILGILPSPPAKLKNGEIFLLEHNLMKLDEQDRALLKQKIAYIPQDPMTSLNPTFTIGNLMVDLIIWRQSQHRLTNYFLKRHRKTDREEARSYAEELLIKVYIPESKTILNRYPIELSGGMRQRVLLAMALIGNPEFLVADEPTTALDVTIQKAILSLIQEKIKEEHLTGMYITHDLGILRSLCNRIYVMYAGVVVESGNTFEILDHPLHPYTKGLIKSIPKLTEEEFIGIQGQIPDYLNIPSGCRFHPRCDERLKVCSSERPFMAEVQKGRFVACNLFQ